MIINCKWYSKTHNNTHYMVDTISVIDYDYFSNSTNVLDVDKVIIILCNNHACYLYTESHWIREL